MTPTIISVAIFMVTVNIALFVWFQRSQAVASTRRMTGMMTRVGLDPGIAAQGDPQTKAVMKETRHRCGRCRVEDFCDRWLAGKAGGGNTFCPNARTFGMLQGAGAHTD